MGIRERTITYLLDLIKAYPGRMADFYIYQVSKEFHLKPKTVSEYLRILHQSGEIIERQARFYPKDFKFGDEEKKEQILLDWLRSKASQDVTPETTKDTPVTAQQVTTVTEEKDRGLYLVVYDIKADIHPSKRRQIYRYLNKAYETILSEGAYAERIQMSVWLVEGRFNANRLAINIPEEISKVRIFKVVEEL
jgi:CRISPR/Cas system-associated endoribonuclease Cas2